MSEKTATEAITIIAEFCSMMGYQAGIASVEGAGVMVSVLAANPELINDFLENPNETFMKNPILMDAGSGCLTWYARGSLKEPKIVSPLELRDATGRTEQ